uniref:Uncharacterized protein n=1 Tax=Setaria italica TaxID=4555 RepID=K3YBP5_SETIT
MPHEARGATARRRPEKGSGGEWRHGRAGIWRCAARNCDECKAE